MNNTATKIQQFAYNIIYYVLWTVELVLLLRFVLKLVGINPANELVAFLYAVSGALLGPFNTMFVPTYFNNMTLEPSVLIAMIFYAVVAYILVSLLKMIEYKEPREFN
jgi:hypothetical protein